MTLSKLMALYRKSKLSYDRRSVGRFVLVSGHYLGPANNFFYHFHRNYLEIFEVSYYGPPYLTRRRVNNILVRFLLGLGMSLWGPSPTEI
jgi:hypothetical protein